MRGLTIIPLFFAAVASAAEWKLSSSGEKDCSGGDVKSSGNDGWGCTMNPANVNDNVKFDGGDEFVITYFKHMEPASHPEGTTYECQGEVKGGIDPSKCNSVTDWDIGAFMVRQHKSQPEKELGS